MTAGNLEVPDYSNANFLMMDSPEVFSAMAAVSCTLEITGIFTWLTYGICLALSVQ